MLLSGAVAGLIGMPQLFGDSHQYGSTIQTGIGFTGIAVALLGRNNPIGIAFGALIFAFLNEQANRLGHPGRHLARHHLGDAGRRRACRSSSRTRSYAATATSSNSKPWPERCRASPRRCRHECRDHSRPDRRRRHLQPSSGYSLHDADLDVDAARSSSCCRRPGSSPVPMTSRRPGTLRAALISAIPIALAGLGGLWSERAGVVNIGLEGMMILGTLGAGYYGYHYGVWVGVLGAMAFGAIGGLLHAIATVVFNVDHIVSGVAINIISARYRGLPRRAVLQRAARRWSDAVAVAGQAADDHDPGPVRCARAISRTRTGSWSPMRRRSSTRW